MIFRDWEAVRDGRKTQTRRVKHECERLILISDAKTVIGHYGRLKWQVGRTYAVQPGRSKPAVGRFELLDIREEQVQDITPEDARAEGAPLLLGYVIEFQLLWDYIWKHRPECQWESDPVVWVLVMRWTDEANQEAA